MYPVGYGVSGVYALLHEGNVVYVGSSKRCVYNRLTHHTWALKHNQHTSARLQQLWNEEQGEGFNWTLLEPCEPEEVRQREAHWSTQHSVLNSRPEGQPFDCSVDTKVKMREGAARRCSDPAHREHLRQRALRQHREGNLGRHTWSEEAERSCSLKMQGRKPKFTEETRAKQRAAWTPERRAAQAKKVRDNPKARAKSGGKWSEETRAKIAILWTPERRAAQAERIRQRMRQRS